MPLNENAISEILPFAPNASEATGDLMPLEDYISDPQRVTGFTAGLARRAIFNRAFRQSAHMAAGLAQFLANRYADGIVDDGDLDKIEAALTAVISGIAEDYANEIGDALDTHAGQTSAHSATSAPTANRLMMRDANGRVQVVGGASPQDVVNIQQLEDASDVKADRSTIFGVGQTWENMLTNRALGIIYTNTTSRPIFINAGGFVSSVWPTSVEVSVDGNRAAVASVVLQGDEVWGVISAVVPPGSEYQVRITQGAATLSFWAELRE